jgi:hypothetical protein
MSEWFFQQSMIVLVVRLQTKPGGLECRDREFLNCWDLLFETVKIFLTVKTIIILFNFET